MRYDQSSGARQLLSSCLLVFCSRFAVAQDSYAFHHENVLGTSLELRANARSLERAQQAEQDVLAEIERLAAIFSTYAADSEFIRWQHSPIGRPMAISPELLQTLKACDRWRAFTVGAFEPGVDELTRLWTLAALQTTDAASNGKSVEPDTVWNGGMELAIDFEINQPGRGSFRRPYVAIWIEDKDGFPVRTLTLWVQSGGERWLNELRRWYKNDRMRKLVEETDLLATISGATRKPGRYNVVWDGTDNAGQLVKPGDYTVCIEAAREHGTYQLMRKKISFGDQPQKFQLEGNTEIKGATLDYRRHESDSRR